MAQLAAFRAAGGNADGRTARWCSHPRPFRTSPAAAVAAMVLGDLGAEVIRVEPEGGDPVRALEGTCVWFRGNRSVTVGPAQMHDGTWQALRTTAT